MILSIFRDQDFPNASLRSLITHDAIAILEVLSDQRSIRYGFDHGDWAPVLEDILIEILWGDLDDDVLDRWS